MPALYNMIITTKGLNLRARADAEELVLQFTKVAIGNGEYDGSEDLLSLTDLKSKKQELAINSKTYANNTVSLKTVVTNTDLEEGYYIKEIGVYAQDPDEPEGTEILYSISLAIDDKWDFLPAEEWGPASIQLSIDTAITNADTVEIKPGSGAYALAEDLAALQSPEFEDYEGETTLPEMDTALGQIKTGNPLVKLLQYIKAALRILDEREVDMSPYDQAIQELIDTDDQLNEDIAAHKSSADHDGRYYTKSQSKLIKFKDIQIKATQDGSATSKIDTHNGLIIPVLADPGSRAWEIFVGLQYATDTLILSGSGVSAGYTYTVRLFYFE